MQQNSSNKDSLLYMLTKAFDKVNRAELMAGEIPQKMEKYQIYYPLYEPTIPMPSTDGETAFACIMSHAVRPHSHLADYTKVEQAIMMRRMDDELRLEALRTVNWSNTDD